MKDYIKKHIAKATRRIITDMLIIEDHSLWYGIEIASDDIAELIFDKS